MFATIQKRDGRTVPFEIQKIANAIFKAAKAVGGENREIAEELAQEVVKNLERIYGDQSPTVEEVQDVVEKVLIENGYARTAKAYILYRNERTRIREAKTDLMDAVAEILVETSRENANVGNSPSAKMLQIASAASKRYYLNRLIPQEFSEAHIKGDIHIHDLDYYSKTINCMQIDLKKLLKEGFNTGYGYIRPPKRISSAAAQAAIILQSNQNDMFGGQSFPHFDRDLGEVIRGLPVAPSEDEIFQAMEGLIYNLNTMHSRAGSQVPFSTINLGCDVTPEGRMVAKAVLKAFDKGLGKGETPIFPNLVFRLKAGVNFNPEDPNYDLFRLAMKVAGHRMNPTFAFMDASINQKYGDEVSYMGCRTRTISNRHGAEVSAGRGNFAPVTINLPRIALKTRSLELFFKELDSTMELCACQLLHRFDVICGLRKRDLPFVMMQNLYMGSEKLGPDDSIREAVKNASFAIGFIGLAETLTALLGRNHGEDSQAQKTGLRIVKYMRKKCDEFAERYDMNFVLYATPAEGISGRFTPMDMKLFGLIPGVTDKEYYTNSYHVPVNLELSIFDKVMIEGEYHKYCNGGHITYVELPSPPEGNIEAIETILRHMARCDVGYAGINFPIDFCEVCGYSGVINLDSCPDCKSASIRRVRRITGYLSYQDRFNDGKLAELRDRRTHKME